MPIICEDTLGSYHYVKEGWGADAPKTAGVVVQARYTERRGDEEPDLNASASEKVKKFAKTEKHLAAFQ